MARFDDLEGIGRGIFVPLERGGLDGLGGAVVGVEVPWCASNSSPELEKPSARDGRRCSCRSTARRSTKWSQGEAHGQKGKEVGDERDRGGRDSPVPWSTAAADGGTASSNPSSLWALGLGFLGQNGEEVVGVKRGVVGGGGVA